jgi:WD40 repeat protein/DNA-binding SARP family transcriptional activator
MARSMEFRLLGPLEVRCDGADVAIASPKQRAVLAALLLDAGRVVPVARLIDTLWGLEEAPRTARITVQNYVMRLRQTLGDAGPERISTRPPGYLISVEPGELDVTRFEELLGSARTAARQHAWGAAAEHARSALSLWRGDPLADMESDRLMREEVPRLMDLRLRAQETRIDADLHLGNHGEVVAELRGLAAVHPEREGLHAQLMLALYRDGRQAEALAAYQRARQALVDEIAAEPGLELRELHQRILAADPALALAPPTAPAAPAAGPGAGPTAIGRDSPYQGLSAFQERDAAFFYGREMATEQLLGRMSSQLDGSGLLVVAGASGVGKSSLLQAGVLPRLREAGVAAAPAAAAWPHVVFTPGRAPLDELAVRVAPLAGADAAAVRRGLDADPAGFALTARQVALAGPGRQAANPDGPPPEPPRLVLLIDQFEQLFTQCPDERQRQAFITALHAAATVGPGQPAAALVVLAVRADFEARCAEYPQLADAVQDRYLVTPMTARQLRMAITEPARTAGSSVDDALVEVLLRELTTRPDPAGARSGAAVSGAGMLPLLSHALDQAWRNRAGDALSLADYERVGGIEGAVADSAQRAYDRLTPAQRVSARQVFTRLTATSSDGADSADRAARAELTEGKDAAQARDVTAVVEAFAAERLLTLAADTVEISHEVLLSAWPLLRDTWLVETHADRIDRTRLHNAAAEWEHHSRDPSYLYHGSLLAAAAGTAARITADPSRHPPLSQTERDFLEAGDRARRRGARRRRGVTVFLVALVIGLAAATGVAVQADQEATSQRDAAVASQLILQSESLGDADPVLAKLESVAAWRIDPTEAARYAMLNAAALPGIAVINGPGGVVDQVAFSPGGTLLALGSGTLGITGEGEVTLWDAATRRQIGAPLVDHTGAVKSMAFSPDGRTLAVGTDDGAVSLWNVATRQQVGPALPVDFSAEYTGGVISIAFSRDGKTLAAVTSDGKVWLLEVAIGRWARVPLAGDPGLVNSAAFSPDGKTLVASSLGGNYITDLTTATLNSTVRMWDLATGRPMRAAPLAFGAGTTYSVAFSPNGKTVAAASLPYSIGHLDGTVRLWNANTGRAAGAMVTAGAGGLTSLSFSPDGKSLVTGGLGGTVRLWDIATGQQVGDPLAGDTDEVDSVAFSPDGRTLATGSLDGTARLWDVGRTVSDTTDGPLAAAAVSSMSLSAGGKTLVSGEPDGAVRLWNTTAPQSAGTLLTAPGTTSEAISPGGGTLATVDPGTGTVRLWNADTRRPAGALALDPVYPLAAAFSPDGDSLATVGVMASTDQGGVQLWDAATRQPLGGPLAGGFPADAVAFSPDGGTLAVGGLDGSVLLWDVATGQESGAPLAAGGGPTSSLAFSPDGATLAVGSYNGTIRLWDLETRQPIGVPYLPGAPVSALAFSPDGRTLIAANTDGTIWRRDVSFLADPASYLCEAAGRPLSRAEWTQYVHGPAYQDICP